MNVQDVTGASVMMRYAIKNLIRDLIGTPGAVAVHRIPHTGNADRTAGPILGWGVTGDNQRIRIFPEGLDLMAQNGGNTACPEMIMQNRDLHEADLYQTVRRESTPADRTS